MDQSNTIALSSPNNNRLSATTNKEIFSVFGMVIALRKIIEAIIPRHEYVSLPSQEETLQAL